MQAFQRPRRFTSSFTMLTMVLNPITSSEVPPLVPAMGSHRRMPIRTAPRCEIISAINTPRQSKAIGLTISARNCSCISHSFYRAAISTYMKILKIKDLPKKRVLQTKTYLRASWCRKKHNKYLNRRRLGWFPLLIFLYWSLQYHVDYFETPCRIQISDSPVLHWFWKAFNNVNRECIYNDVRKRDIPEKIGKCCIEVKSHGKVQNAGIAFCHEY